MHSSQSVLRDSTLRRLGVTPSYFLGVSWVLEESALEDRWVGNPASLESGKLVREAVRARMTIRIRIHRFRPTPSALMAIYYPVHSIRFQSEEFHSKSAGMKPITHPSGICLFPL